MAIQEGTARVCLKSAGEVSSHKGKINFKVQEPSSEIDLQNAMYNGRLHSALITGVLCFSVDGLLIWAKHNCVGSWNDGDMSRELQEKLIDEHYCDEE